jgi:hypothetical protein
MLAVKKKQFFKTCFAIFSIFSLRQEHMSLGAKTRLPEG